MGQLIATLASPPRVMFDEEGDNGLVLCDKYLPVEVLIEILSHADCKTLLNCQLVCKRWKMLMGHIWHKKTERALARPFPWNDSIPWSVYYLTCMKRPYERNLLRNHSGAEDVKYWKLNDYFIIDGWDVEEPPVGVPELPQTEPMFKDQQICFTTYLYCSKTQAIILTNEGIHSYILDVYQPPIVVSEWYSCRWDCPAVYELEVKLIHCNGDVIDEFKFEDIIEGEKQNQWLKISHVFKNYGIGLRKIIFEHHGRDIPFTTGYGSKMAGAYICVKIPHIPSASVA